MIAHQPDRAAAVDQADAPRAPARTQRLGRVGVGGIGAAAGAAVHAARAGGRRARPTRVPPRPGRWQPSDHTGAMAGRRADSRGEARLARSVLTGVAVYRWAALAWLVTVLSAPARTWAAPAGVAVLVGGAVVLTAALTVAAPRRPPPAARRRRSSWSSSLYGFALLAARRLGLRPHPHAVARRGLAARRRHDRGHRLRRGRRRHRRPGRRARAGPSPPTSATAPPRPRCRCISTCVLYAAGRRGGRVRRSAGCGRPRPRSPRPGPARRWPARSTTACCRPSPSSSADRATPSWPRSPASRSASCATTCSA